MLAALYSSGSSGSAPSGGGGGQLGVLGLEGVADVLEEDEPEDDVLVLGRVHVVAEHVGRGPELGRLGLPCGCGATTQRRGPSSATPSTRPACQSTASPRYSANGSNHHRPVRTRTRLGFHSSSSRASRAGPISRCTCRRGPRGLPPPAGAIFAKFVQVNRLDQRGSPADAGSMAARTVRMWRQNADVAVL
jgi:hypothetical protein